MADDHVIGKSQPVQAANFVRELQWLVGTMTSRLAWVERRSLMASNARSGALRTEAAGLRRDIREAQSLIERLERCYLARDTVGANRAAQKLRPVSRSAG